MSAQNRVVRRPFFLHRLVQGASLRVAFAVALCCCAMLMQSIGLLHTYAHPRDGHSHLVQQASADVADNDRLAATEKHPAHASQGWLHAMFAGHDDGAAGCTLFDQLAHADVLHDASALALGFASPVHPDAVHAAWHHATQATGFLARGPPALG